MKPNYMRLGASSHFFVPPVAQHRFLLSPQIPATCGAMDVLAVVGAPFMGALCAEHAAKMPFFLYDDTDGCFIPIMFDVTAHGDPVFVDVADVVAGVHKAQDNQT